MSERCKECRFFLAQPTRFAADQPGGECRRNPLPVPATDDHWCGEWRPKDQPLAADNAAEARIRGRLAQCRGVTPLIVNKLAFHAERHANAIAKREKVSIEEAIDRVDFAEVARSLLPHNHGPALIDLCSFANEN